MGRQLFITCFVSGEQNVVRAISIRARWRFRGVVILKSLDTEAASVYVPRYVFD